NDTTAGFYISVMFQQQYICGDGLEMLKSPWNCQYSYLNCKKPSVPTLCTDLILYNQCKADMISKRCGDDAGRFQCNLDNISIKYTTYCTQRVDCDNLNSTSKLGFRSCILFVIAFYFLK
ncbi:hypothetical protein FO519_010262, partial [Halicephalobus sp. NKZ332]